MQQDRTLENGAAKAEKAAHMWRELREFAEIAERRNFTLSAFYEGMQQRQTPEGVQTKELQMFVPDSLSKKTLVNVLHFTHEEIQSPFIHIIDRIAGKPEQRRDVYIHVGSDGTQKVAELAIEGETWVGRATQLTPEDLELLRFTGQASAVPYTVLQEYGSAHDFRKQVQRGDNNQQQEGIGIDGINDRGWTLYEGGLSGLVDTLKQGGERKLASSTDEIRKAGPFAEAPRMFRAITQRSTPPPASQGK